MAPTMSTRRSIATASFKILDVEVVGHVLEDGTRIIEADCLEKLMRAMTGPDPGAKIDLMELQRFSSWQRGEA